MPLVPEAGGTERITSIIARGLSERGYNCLGILQFTEGSDQMIYEGKIVEDLYSFLKDNHVDVVINQIAYATWLLLDFLDRGGNRWHKEGGKIISCLHFDPRNPSYVKFLRSYENLTLSQRLMLIRQYVLQPYYLWRQQRNEGQVLNYIYDNSDALVTLSATHFKYMQKVMRRDEYSKIHAIGNPLTFPNIADKSLLDTKEKTVIVCARMSEYHKRVTLVLKAWGVIKHHAVANKWKLEIVGDGPDLSRYRRIVEQKRIADVTFVGQQSPLRFYERASILLLTSSAEGWGLTITEGLQNGVVPVVMNSSPVYSDIIQHRYNGLLTPDGNVKKFADSILMLMEDSECLHSMQLNALMSAQNFTLANTLEKWIDLLNVYEA